MNKYNVKYCGMKKWKETTEINLFPTELPVQLLLTKTRKRAVAY